MRFNIRMRPNGSLTLFPEQVTKLDLSSLDCKEGHMKKIRLFVCLHQGQKNIDLRTHL